MSELKTAPYGTWESPITAELAVGDSVRLNQIVIDGRDILWSEMRPQEGGRSVIMSLTEEGQAVDMIPANFNARTRVHEYGGGDFAAHAGTIYFSNFEDQRVYRRLPGGETQPLTPSTGMRYADFVVDHRRALLIAIREEHPADGDAVNTIVSIDPGGGDNVLLAGNDFYSSPRLSPDGSHLAWLTWNHPNMPWDGTELWVAEFENDGKIKKGERIAGGDEESVFQPEWSPDGVLHFVSDRTGWWNLYRCRNGRTESIWEIDAEFGLPQWVFGMSTYGFESARRIICSYARDGVRHLAKIDTDTGHIEPIDSPYTDIKALRATSGFAVFIGASRTDTDSVVCLNLETGRREILRCSFNAAVGRTYLSVPEAIEFPTENGVTAHGFFYRPKNGVYAAPRGEQPPLLVLSHGGPTSASSDALDLEMQYWTSRGIAVLDMNYGGSTGFGRDYRKRLDGQWGIVDVEDCINGARFLVQRGEVDGQRLAISGGSAGGYTTLCALTFHDTFHAGASHYGVSDLSALARDTHKFESRYLDRLIGPFPQEQRLYHARSPIHFTDRLRRPMILMQGLEDKIVPPAQAEMMVDALREKKLPVAYLPFEGEQHGFRRAANRKRALEAEFYFYSRVFGFESADWIEPVLIDNL